MSQSVLQKRPHLIPSIIAATMLIAALANWPYGYYQLLRFIVCFAAVYVAFVSYNWKKIWATWLFGFIVLLFNPLIPINLSRKTWQPIDVICAILFVVILFLFKEPEKKQEDTANNNKIHGKA